MGSVLVEAKKRDKIGKYHSKTFKKEGSIPAVVYGDNVNTPILLNEREFNKIFNSVGEHTLLSLNIDGKAADVLIKDYQEHPVTRKLIHVDFFKVNPDKKVQTHIPVHHTGLAIGVKSGGMLEQYVHSLHIECLPKDIPHEIVLDVTNLKIKDGIYVRDLTLGDKINILTAADQAIFLVHITKVVDETAEAEGEAAVEGTAEGAEK